MYMYIYIYTMQAQVHASMNPSTTSSVASLGNIGRWAVAPLHKIEVIHADACTQSSFYTQMLYTEKPLHRATLTQSRNSFCTQWPLHKGAFLHKRFLHIGAFTHRSFYARRFSHGSFTQRSV